VLLCDF